jgi:hypothetical protein
MRALLLSALLLLLALHGAAAEPDIRVHVRVEGSAQQLWSGWVTLGTSYTLTASSGRSYALEARTPLGALQAASRQAGLALDVTDEFEDLVALSIGGEYHWDVHWWDYRVDWVRTDYGAQRQWTAFGQPVWPIAEGSHVLWYVDGPLMSIFRMSDLGPALGAGPCARAELVEAPVLDPRHDPGAAWPQVTWGPAPTARLAGSLVEPVVAGAGLAASGQAAWVWAEPQRLPVVEHVRSERAWLPCPAFGA